MTIKNIIRQAVPENVIGWYRRWEYERSLSAEAKQQRTIDRSGLRGDIDPEIALALVTDWLCRAQDNAMPPDGGTARHFSLNSGWSPSYPETTGYIVPTILTVGARSQNSAYNERARRMLDWLVSIQLSDGAFQGGLISHEPVPVTFNTGQILIGLAAGVGAFGSDTYGEAMNKAAIWLRDSQDADGCWRRYPTPFAQPGEKAYETHVSWGLLEAERHSPGNDFGDSAIRQIHWALGKVSSNGWIADCCLSNPEFPLTHTLGYALRGILEGYRWNQERDLLAAAESVAGGLLSCVREDGHLPGRLDKKWNPAVDWVCLTGSVQVAACFLDLYEWTDDSDWLHKGLELISFVRRTILQEGLPGAIGGIAGSFPVDGDYGAFEYLNWPAKFYVDAQMQALRISSELNAESA